MKLQTMLRAVLLLTVVVGAEPHVLRARQATEAAGASGPVAYLDVFDVKPENQQKVSDLLIQVSQLIKMQKGYVSATLYQTADGARVINIGTWSSQEDFQAMLKNTEIVTLIRQAAGLSDSFKPAAIRIVFEDRTAR